MLKDRASMLLVARNEMQNKIAKSRLARALKHCAPWSTENSYQQGDLVLIWEQKVLDNCLGEWIGPFKILDMDADKNLAYVQDVKVGNARPMHVAQVLRYYEHEQIGYSMFLDIERVLRYFSNRQASDDSFYLMEIVDSSGPRLSFQKMSYAKKAELKGLLDWGTFSIILPEEVQSDANILPGRFVPAFKYREDGQIKFKAPHIIGVHRDRLKSPLVHDAVTVQL